MLSVLLYEAETSGLSAVNTQICDWRQKCQPHKFVYLILTIRTFMLQIATKKALTVLINMH